MPQVHDWNLNSYYLNHTVLPDTPDTPDTLTRNLDQLKVKRKLLLMATCHIDRRLLSTE